MLASEQQNDTPLSSPHLYSTMVTTNHHENTANNTDSDDFCSPWQYHVTWTSLNKGTIYQIVGQRCRKQYRHALHLIRGGLFAPIRTERTVGIEHGFVRKEHGAGQ
jgi:hypothetical protein